MKFNFRKEFVVDFEIEVDIDIDELKLKYMDEKWN